MTTNAASREAGNVAPLSELGSRAALALFVLLLAQVGLYVWMAPRGFDFTDESYYFLNYLYWRDLIGTMSFFGAYFEWPFRMLGQSVPAIRIFSLLLLLASSAFFTREVLRYVSRRDGSTSGTPWAFVVAGMAASLFYFGPPLSTLRAPSYNLLALGSMLVATGLLLRVLEQSSQVANARLTMFCYGLAIGACGLGKASSGVMLVLLHALFFVLANRDWRLRHLIEFLALSLAGVSLNFVVLQLAHPQWLEELREGVALVSMDGSHNLLGSVNSFRWKIQALAPIFLAWAVGSAVIVALWVRWTVRFRRTALSALVVVLVGGSVLGLIKTMDGSHNLLGSVNSFRWKIQALAPIFLPWALGAGVVVALWARWIIRSRRTALSALVVVLVGGSVLGLIWGPKHWWLPLLGLAVLLLWSVEGFSRKPFRLVRGDLTNFALMALLLALPVAFSFGTGMPLLEHSQMAAVFAITALLLRLLRLARLGILAPPALVVCLAALCLPTLVTQLRAATDVHYTYRQLSALGEQAKPVRLGAANNTLLVDAATRETLESVIGAARAAGLTPGRAILDFTGDGPGLIYALGGRPLGTAWLLGGYPGSQTIAAHVVEKLPVQALRNAWLLSSDNNPRAIKGWQQSLNARLGPDAHELVATVHIRAPYRWGENAPDSLSVQIWKPQVAALAEGK
jgi:hypothetical protein